jgi:transcriptional regulator with XRE-family HTH domain
MGQVLREFRRHPDHGTERPSQRDVAEWANLTQSQISRIESGTPITDLNRLVYWAELLRIPEDELWFALPDGPAGTNDASPAVATSVPGRPRGSLVLADGVRRDLQLLLGRSTVSEEILCAWDQAVRQYGAATRDRPPDRLLIDIALDLDDVRSALDACRSVSTSRRLLRLAAQMSGLLCLTLIKMGEHNAFRHWARLARATGVESGDRATLAWVLAQEAYGHYYLGDMPEAIRVAQHAQAVRRKGDVAIPLAAALEARAHAVGRDERQARAALDRAESSLEDLDGAALLPSAFGYNEAQFRFHEGNAYTHLRRTSAAMSAQAQAIKLCAPGDYTDRALTQLDRATCLLHDGDVGSALQVATETLRPLTPTQRAGIIATRGQEILRNVPAKARSLPARTDLLEILITAGTARGS